MEWPSTRLQRYAALVVSLACYIGAFSVWPPLMLLAPGLLGRAVHKCSLKEAVVLSLLFGFGLSAFFQYWVFSFNILPWLCLLVIRGVPWVCFGLVARFDKGISGLLVGPALYLTSLTLLLGSTGNDWEQPAAALASYPWTLSLLPWLGLTGYALVTGVLSGLLLSSNKKASIGAALLSTGALVLSFWLYPAKADLSQNRVALVQSGWSQEEKWDEHLVKLIASRLFELTETGAERGAQLVVWPETAWPLRNLRKRPADTRAIGRLARKLNVQILASSIEEQEGSWSNSVSQIQPTGRFSDEYIKKRLAPFAEYLPGPEFLKKQLRRFSLIDQISYFVPGDNSSVFEIDGEHFGLMVCYESMHPSPAAAVNEEVDFFVVVTNDAPLGSEFAKECHFRSAILRAAQFRKPVYQASNTGVTGIVNARGDVVVRTSWGESRAGVLTESGFTRWDVRASESATDRSSDD